MGDRVVRFLQAQPQRACAEGGEQGDAAGPVGVRAGVAAQEVEGPRGGQQRHQRDADRAFDVVYGMRCGVGAPGEQHRQREQRERNDGRIGQCAFLVQVGEGQQRGAGRRGGEQQQQREQLGDIPGLLQCLRQVGAQAGDCQRDGKVGGSRAKQFQAQQERVRGGARLACVAAQFVHQLLKVSHRRSSFRLNIL